MILRNKFTKLQEARTGADDITPNTSMFSGYKSAKTETGLITPETGFTYPKTISSFFTNYKPTITVTPTVEPTKTSGTFGEVTKALGGSFVSGALNLISTAVGTAERSLIAGTEAEGKGIVAMWDNVIRAFSPETTKEERAKIAEDIVRVGLNLTHPESRPLLGTDTMKSVYNLEGGSTAEQQVKKAETAIRSWADIENESGLVKFFGGVGESLPASIVTRIPVVGWYLMGNQTYKNIMDQTRAEYQAKGEVMPEGLATLKALGYTAIEIGTEMLFPLFGKIGASAVKGSLGTATKGLVEMAIKKLGVKTAKEVSELSLKTIAKAVTKEAAGEGVEEVLANLGQAGIAALTTNPDDPYWSIWSKDGGLTSLDSLFMSFASGAVMGGGMTAVRGGAKLMFKNTNNIVNDLKDKPIEQITPEEMQEFKDAVVLDFTQNENGEQEFVTENVTNFIGKIAPIQGQTFKTKSGKLFTVPANAEPNISNVSMPVLQDSIAQKATQAESIVAQPQAVQTPVEAVAPSQTVNMPTAQANVPNVPVEGINENERIIIDDIRNQPIKKVQDILTKLSAERDSLYKSARGDPETLAMLDRFISVAQSRISQTTQEVPVGEPYNESKISRAKQGVTVGKPYIQMGDYRYYNDGTFKKITAKSAKATPTAEPTPIKKATTETKAKAVAKTYTVEQLQTAKGKLLKGLQNSLNDADKVDIQNKIAKIDKAIEKQKKSALVEESQKQDTSGTQGIVSQQYAKMMTEKPSEPAWKKTISPETRKAIDVASKPNADQTWWTWFKDRLGKFHENFTLGSVPIEVGKADIRRLFREARAASQYAKGQAENIISKSYNKAGKDKYDLLRHSIIYLDIAEDLQAGLYDSGSAMMFNIKSPEEALQTIYAIKEELKKPENQLVRDALETRKKLMDEVRDQVIAEGNKAGIDLNHIKSKANYMYHAITEFREEFNAALKAKGTRRGVGRVEYMARVGSARDYISDPMMADYLVLQKMQRDLTRLKLYNEIKTEDISRTMPYSETEDWKIKPGYSELDPSMLGIVEFDKFSKQQAKAMVSANMQSRGIDPHSDAGKRAMAKIMTKYNNHVMVVPTQIVDAVVNEFANRETTSGKTFKKLMNVWKYMKIKMPNAVWKYNVRNLFGDLDPIVAAKPNALLRIPRALKELYGFFYKGGVLTSDLQDYIKRGGVTTGQTPQELKTFNTSKLIKVYDESTKTVDVAKKAIRKIWSALTLETATQYREQVLRYATYLAYTNDLAKIKTGLPKYYAASIPAEIQGLKDIKDRAYKLSNDLVGAYDDVSIAGQWAADHLMPFFRFKEVNIKRNYRMLKNSFYNDGVTLENTAQQARNKLGNVAKASTFTIFRLAKLMLGVSAFYGALALANGLIAGDDEDELPEDVQNSPHITIPRWMTGGEKVYYIDRLGSFAEFMNMFGIDYSMGSDLNDIATGRMQLSDKIKEMASSPLLDAFNSSWPVAKIAFELVTGKTYFPDPKNPATIRDIWEYVFSQVGFKDEYKALAGKPIDQGSYLMQKRNILFNSVMPGDAAFYDVYDMVDEYYKSIGESNTFMNYMDKNTDKYKKSQAVYYYKSALKLGDAKAAEKYLAEYVLYGGTKATLKDSMAYLDPTNALSSKKKADFLKWITPEQKETYDKAMEYYKELQEISSDIAFPKTK